MGLGLDRYRFAQRQPTVGIVVRHRGAGWVAKMGCTLTLVSWGRQVKLVSKSLDVSRSQLTARIKSAPEDHEARRRCLLDDAALVDRIKASIPDCPAMATAG